MFRIQKFQERFSKQVFTRHLRAHTERMEFKKVLRDELPWDNFVNLTKHEYFILIMKDFGKAMKHLRVYGKIAMEEKKN